MFKHFPDKEMGLLLWLQKVVFIVILKLSRLLNLPFPHLKKPIPHKLTDIQATTEAATIPGFLLGFTAGI